MTGEELKKAIKDAGFTISEFAEKLGMSQQSLSARLSRKSVRADFAEKVIMTIREKGNKMIFGTPFFALSRIISLYINRELIANANGLYKIIPRHA